MTTPRRHEGIRHRPLNSEGIHTHTHPAKIREMVTADQWDSYDRITCIRNPWDTAVSLFFWTLKLADYHGVKNLDISDRLRSAVLHMDFSLDDPEYRALMKHGIGLLSRNCDFYFKPSGDPYASIYLRHETLQADFDKVCQRLGLETSELPRLKTFTRPSDLNYRDFYDDELRDMVSKVASRSIDFFGYEF